MAKSEYEFSHHRIIGKKIGLTDEDIVRVTKGPNAQGWQTSERDLLQAVDELFHDRTLSDSTWSKLSKQYSEKQLLDLIIAVGQYNSVSTLLNALHVPLEEGAVGWSDLMPEKIDP